MALGGGVFTTQNKKLPGSYINFVSAERASATLGDRGVCAVPMELNWGPDNGVLTLSSEDFINNSQKILGYDYTHEYCKPFREIFKNAKLAYIAKLNTNAVRAENEFCTAKYGGVRGNDIKIIITNNVDEPSAFDVKTLLDNLVMDEQKGVTNTNELKANDLVTFKQGVPLKLTANTPLSGGSNGQGTKAFNQYAEALAAGPSGNDITISITAGAPVITEEAKKATNKYAEAVTAGAAGNDLTIKIENGAPYQISPAVKATNKYATAVNAGATGNNLKIKITEGTEYEKTPAVKASCKYGSAKIAGAAGNKLTIKITQNVDESTFDVKINDGSSDVFTKEQATTVNDIGENDYVEWSGEEPLAIEDVPLTNGADAVMANYFVVATLNGSDEVDKQESIKSQNDLVNNDYVEFLKSDDLTTEELALSGGKDAVMGDTYNVITLNDGAPVDTQSNLKSKTELSNNAYVVFTKTADLSVEQIPLSGGADAVISPRYTVITKVMGEVKDTQENIGAAGELIDNNYVKFITSSDLELGDYPLSGGAESINGANWQNALNVLEGYSFNTLGIVSNDDMIKSLATAYTKRLRDEVGIKFQTVVFNYNADDKGVINVVNGLSTNDKDPSIVYWTTGAQCGCKVYESLTNVTYNGELDIDVLRTQSQLESCVDKGQFVFHKVGDDVRVLTDINSKVTVTVDENDDFKSNQTIRVLDQIGNDIAAIFNNRYLGKIPNDAAGRTALWNDIVKHHQELARLRAIENFASEDITVLQGNDKKSVVVNDSVTPTNALEKLYMTCVVA